MAGLSRYNSMSSIVENSECDSGLPSPHFLSGLSLLMAPKFGDNLSGCTESPVIPLSGKLAKFMLKQSEQLSEHSCENDFENDSVADSSKKELTEHQEGLDRPMMDNEDEFNKTCSEVSEILCAIPSTMVKEKLEEKGIGNETERVNKHILIKDPNITPFSTPLKPNNLNIDDNISSQETQDVMLLSSGDSCKITGVCIDQNLVNQSNKNKSDTEGGSDLTKDGRKGDIKSSQISNLSLLLESKKKSQETREISVLSNCEVDNESDKERSKDLFMNKLKLSSSNKSQSSQEVLIMDKNVGISQKGTQEDETQKKWGSVGKKIHSDQVLEKDYSNGGSATKAELDLRANWSKSLKRHTHELSVIKRAFKQLECGEGILQSENSPRAAETVQKTLAHLQKMLAGLSTSHKYERSALVDRLREKGVGREEKVLLKEQGQLLQERQRQLLLLFRKHKNLSDKLKTVNLNSSSRKSSQSSSHKTGSGTSGPRGMSQSVANQGEGQRVKCEQWKIPQAMEKSTSAKVIQCGSKDKPIQGKATVCESSESQGRVGFENETKTKKANTNPIEGTSRVFSENTLTSNIRVVDTRKDVNVATFTKQKVLTPPKESTDLRIVEKEQSMASQPHTLVAEPEAVLRKTFQKQNTTPVSQVTSCQAAGIFVSACNVNPSRTIESENNPNRRTPEQNIIPAQPEKPSQISIASKALCSPEPVKNTAPATGKRQMPKQVADINILMSPNSSLDLSVATSPRKNFCHVPLQRPPLLKANTQPVTIPPSQLVIMRPGPEIQAVPIKKVCRPVEVTAQVAVPQKDLLELKDLVAAGVLKPAPQILSLFTGKKRVFASLTEDGYIQSTGGEIFRSPMQWCTALLNPTSARNSVRRNQAYDKVLYNGVPLSHFKLPSAAADVTTTTLSHDTPENIPELATNKSLIQQDVAAASVSCGRSQLWDALSQHIVVRILSNEELIPNKPLLSDDFFGVHVPDNKLPQELLKCIDCW